MKQLIKSKQLKIVLIVLIIIAGIAMIAVKGFNFDLKYQDTQRVELYLETEFNIADIKQITNEVFGNQKVMIQKVEVFEDSVSITTTSISDEQKNNLITKINEKYGTELKAEDIQIEDIAHTRGRDIIKPYIIPFAIAVIATLVYIGIRYYKLNTAKVILKSIGILLLSQVLLFSVIAITRIPIGRLTIPMVILVYLLTLFGMTSRYEKNLANRKKEEVEHWGRNIGDVSKWTKNGQKGQVNNR